VKVALDFVSPESIDECVKLTKEFRRLPLGHKAKEDKLEVGYMFSAVLLRVNGSFFVVAGSKYLM
jgi:hypothetical protein